MAKKKQAQHHTRKKNGALAAMENNFEEKLMATIHSSKVNIEPLKKEPDTNAKRFVRSDEEEKKKSPEKRWQSRIPNLPRYRYRLYCRDWFRFHPKKKAI